MDGYEHPDLDEIDFAPMEYDTERLRLLTLDEADELIQVLRTTTEEGGSAAQEADRLAREIGALTGYWPRSAQILPLRPAAVRARCYPTPARGGQAVCVRPARPPPAHRTDFHGGRQSPQ
ncbi:DUF6417 family protein [Streptomyces sp. NPDC059755]|uniref:DUF6417 family protein n=1 Tax=Streptomyces sp. NPDC059755 TaxID=3346934 RepID=UPI00364AC31D